MKYRIVEITHTTTEGKYWKIEKKGIFGFWFPLSVSYNPDYFSLESAQKAMNAMSGKYIKKVVNEQ